MLATVAEKVGSVFSAQEAEYRALIRGLKLAGRWKKNERCTDFCEEARDAPKAFKDWQLSWVPSQMNGEADKFVDLAFRGELVIHASDAEGPEPPPATT